MVLLAESAQKRAVVLRMQHSQLEPALLSALRLAHWPESDVERAAPRAQEALDRLRELVRANDRLRISYGEWRKEHTGRYHIFPPISFVQWIFCKGKHSICDHDDRGGGEFQRLHDRFIFLSQGAAAEERLVALIVLCVEASSVQTVSESEEDLRLFLKCLPSGAKTFGTGLPTDLIEYPTTSAGGEQEHIAE